MGTERLNFEGKVVVATGVGSGIGAAIADCFAACGATVIGLERDAEKLNCSATRITKEGGRFHPILADVSSAEDVAKAFGEINARFPAVDVLVKLSVPALLLRFRATSPRSKEISPPNLTEWRP